MPSSWHTFCKSAKEGSTTATYLLRSDHPCPGALSEPSASSSPQEERKDFRFVPSPSPNDCQQPIAHRSPFREEHGMQCSTTNNYTCIRWLLRRNNRNENLKKKRSITYAYRDGLTTLQTTCIHILHKKLIQSNCTLTYSVILH